MVPGLVFAHRMTGGIVLSDGIGISLVLVLAAGGFAAALGAYLLVEPVVRPVLASVLPEDPDAWPATMGITVRLLATWFVVAAVPLLTLGYVAAAVSEGKRAIVAPSLFVGSILSRSSASASSRFLAVPSPDRSSGTAPVCGV